MFRQSLWGRTRRAWSCLARATPAALILQLDSSTAPGPCCYLQDLIHDFLHDLTLSFRIAGAQKQEEIQVTKEDTESRDKGALC